MPSRQREQDRRKDTPPGQAQQLIRQRDAHVNQEAREPRADGRRAVNIDPGLITRERLILATGKNAGHRVYLGRGVFADLTLLYRSGGFEPLPWTYPDYASPEVRAVMKDLRVKYLDQLRRIRREAS